MAHEDTTNDAAIAHLLASQLKNEYIPYHNVDPVAQDDDDDSDYESSLKRKKRAAARKDDSQDDEPGGANGDERTYSGRRRRKDIGAKRQPGRAWTEREEALFLEALDLYGRDWKAGADHVRTRDHRAIASHAQKYFIKLCLSGAPLPPKVAESGLGYTLSGSMLDPYSAAARSYGFKPELLLRLKGEALQTALRGLDVDKLPVCYGGRMEGNQPPPSVTGKGRRDEERNSAVKKYAVRPVRPEDLAGKRLKMEDMPVPGMLGQPGALQAPGQPDLMGLAPGVHVMQGGQGVMPDYLSGSAADQGGLGDMGMGYGSFTALLTAGMPVAPGQVPVLQTGGGVLGQPSAIATGHLQAGLSQQTGMLAGATLSSQTEYARNRPKRELATQRLQIGATNESLSLVKAQDFIGTPGSGAAMSQPFSVAFSSWVMLTLDFHAHLSMCEVIGLLSGTWDTEQRLLCVMEAYPVPRAEGSAAGTSVEMDPAAAAEAGEMMAQRGQRMVGWYHSHPVFEPSPSQKDMENQRNYQAMVREPPCSLEPFVGVIVGPYDTRMMAPLSMITTFVVQQRAAQPLMPYNVSYTLHGLDCVPDQGTIAKLLSLLDLCRDDVARVDFREPWRPFTLLNERGEQSGSAISKLLKLRISLSNHMKDADMGEVQQLLNYLCAQIQSRWNLDLGMDSSIISYVNALPSPQPRSDGNGTSGDSGDGASPVETVQVAPDNGASFIAALAAAAAAGGDAASVRNQIQNPSPQHDTQQQQQQQQLSMPATHLQNNGGLLNPPPQVGGGEMAPVQVLDTGAPDLPAQGKHGSFANLLTSIDRPMQPSLAAPPERQPKSQGLSAGGMGEESQPSSESGGGAASHSLVSLLMGNES